MMHCPRKNCHYASLAKKYCPRHGTELIAGPLKPATNRKCPLCKSGGVFPKDRFCGNCRNTDLLGVNVPLNSVLELSVRAKNCLESEHINFFYALTQRTERDLLEIKGFGKGLLEEVKKKLAGLGFKLKDK